MRPHWRLALVAAVVLLVGCGGDGERLTVFAAASLTDVMDDAAASFESTRDGVEVVVSVAGSQQLAAQIRDGAPADVFISADRRQVDAVSDLLASEPRVIATNELAVAVPSGNPDDISTLADLTDPDLTLVLPAPEVPAGAYARAALRAAGVELEPDDLTADVRAAVARVALGEADAAIVYRSDLRANRNAVEAVGVELDADVRYFAAVVGSSDVADTARDFLDFLSEDDEAQRILGRHGFGTP